MIIASNFETAHSKKHIVFGTGYFTAAVILRNSNFGNECYDKISSRLKNKKLQLCTIQSKVFSFRPIRFGLIFFDYLE
jgi:hypothetical protein